MNFSLSFDRLINICLTVISQVKHQAKLHKRSRGRRT